MNDEKITDATWAGNHTDGPWFVTPDGFRVTDKKTWFDQDGSRHGETPNIVIFAETKANACLIAAAPDMLEALRTIATCSNCASSRATARAAIAKAEGKQ